MSRKPFAGWKVEKPFEALFGTLIFIVIIGLVVFRFSLLWRAYGGDVGWRIPAYEELRSASGVFVVDREKSSPAPYRFKSSYGEDLVLQCYPTGDAYRIFDSNTCLAGRNKALDGGVVDIRYFQITQKSGRTLSILGEVSRNGMSILPFSESLASYRTTFEMQKREKSGSPFIVIIFGLTIIALIFVFLKK